MREIHPPFIYEHGISREADCLDGYNLIATTQLPVYSGFDLTLVDRSRASLTERVILLAQPQGVSAVRDFEEIADFRYCLSASCYHLSRIADQYSRIVQLFNSLDGPVIEGNTNHKGICYEFDAFLSAGIRSLEVLRRVLWKCYSVNGKMWPSYSKMLESQSILPTAIRDGIENHMTADFRSLRAYRNCLAHHFSPGPENGIIRLFNFKEEWGIQLNLPSNPNKHRREELRWDGPELLSFSWRVMLGLVELGEYVMRIDEIKKLVEFPEDGPHFLRLNKMSEQS